MNFKTLKCKIFTDPDSEFENEYTIGELHIDIDSINSFRVSDDDKECTVIYANGLSYELLISVSELSRLKGLNSFIAPKKELYILTFSKN